ncbi:MAG: glycosyltransferase [Bacteroidales bacterium]|nr:glycosyltransferase [Bacteroidales bacterium]
MISILIPVFNNNITDLVHDLYKQIEVIPIRTEIIIVDDASEGDDLENSKLSELKNVKYERLIKNIGRSKIRNYLASLANFDYLLFIDCDAKVINNKFIKNYADCIKKNREVVCGGLVYENKKPQNHKLYFRWYYGINREYRTIDKRIKEPFKSFSSFNFLIKKNVFQQIRFDEEILNYGHEDTLLGLELQKQITEIYHIDNPLLHDGLEDAGQFISKTNQSVKNLKYLVKNYPKLQSLTDTIKLIKYVQFIKRIKLAWLFRLFYSLANKVFIKNLLSKHPSLYIFDFYKICYYFSL